MGLVAFDLPNFDWGLFNQILKSKQLDLKTSALEKMVENSKHDSVRGDQIVIPHKCCLSLFLGCFQLKKGKDNNFRLFLALTLYLNKKFQETKTNVDDDLARLSSKFLRLQNPKFITYQVLYFLKECNKIKDENLRVMSQDAQAYLETLPAPDKYLQILQNSLKEKDFSDRIVNYLDAYFILIIEGCIGKKVEQVVSAGKILRGVQELVPRDFQYLLHHAFHWVGQILIDNQSYVQAIEYLKSSIKYKKCEFSLENKNIRLLAECK